MSLQIVEYLCAKYHFTQHMTEEAIAKWKEISTNNRFIATSIPTKTILSAVCIYITLLQNGKPITITQICHGIDCSIECIGNKFRKVLNDVMKSFPLYKIESIPIEDLVEVTLSECEVSDDEREALIKRVKEIIWILRKFGLIEGRSPVHIIFGSAFIAWKSLRANIRSKIKLTEFCNTVNIDYKNTISKRVTELMHALKQMASKIPIKKDFIFSKNNIAIHLEDILEYKNSLFFDVIQQNQNIPKDNSTEVSLDSMNAFKRKLCENEFSGIESKVKEEMDEEISDTEIESYIRSEKEVKLIKKLKKIAEIQNEDEEKFYGIENFVKVEVNQ